MLYYSYYNIVSDKESCIRLISNPSGRMCDEISVNQYEYIDKIDSNEDELIYMRGAKDTPSWNAGLWFKANRTDEIINIIKNLETKEWKSEKRTWVICPGCSEVFEKGENVKFFTIECETLSKQDSNFKGIKYFQDSLIGRATFHEGCEKRIIERIRELEKESVVGKI